jgi:signal transduction histidine kinase
VRPFLHDYRTLGRQAVRVERVLAVGRAFLATTALGAIYLDPTEPARFATLTYVLLAAYAVYSVLVLVLVGRLLPPGRTTARLAHGTDILWASALTLFTDAPVSPFFLFFLFALLSAAYRWGFRETLATALLLVVIFLAQTAVLTAVHDPPTWLADGTFELNAIMTRVAYLLLTGFLLGYLADQEKQFRAELAATADMVRQPRVDLGLGGSAAAVARLLRRIFEASRVDLVIQEHETHRTFLWHVDATTAAGREPVPRVELEERQRADWLFAAPSRTWWGRREADGRLAGHAVQPDRWGLSPTHVELPGALAEAREFTSVTVADFGLASEWRGRVLLYDAAAQGAMASRLHFLDTLAEQVGPALTSVVLLRRLRSRAGAVERARVARELHDGTIQALIGIDMEMEVIRRQAEPQQPPLAGEIARLQQLLRQEVQALREMMQGLRPVDLDASDQLPEVLVTMVERFSRDAGIAAHVAAVGSTATLPLRVAIGIVRIVQEALVNVRKHSGAAHVSVRLERHADAWVLRVEDDGRGFEFSGRRTGVELVRTLAGPSMIVERAQALGATLSVESRPGAGAGIEVVFREGGDD